MVYNPDTIAAYWGKRPRAVATRIVQLTSVAGGFLSRLLWDLINNKIKEVIRPSPVSHFPIMKKVHSFLLQEYNRKIFIT